MHHRGQLMLIERMLGVKPHLTRQMEERIGSDFSDDNVRAAAAGLGATLDPPGDVHASAEYRRHLAEVLAARAVIAARERR